MNIIKKLIKKQKLLKELRSIKNKLADSDYYDKERQLSKLIRQPDAYADLYIQIHQEYGELLNRQWKINAELTNLVYNDLQQKQDTYTK